MPVPGKYMGTITFKVHDAIGICKNVQVWLLTSPQYHTAAVIRYDKLQSRKISAVGLGRAFGQVQKTCHS